MLAKMRKYIGLGAAWLLATGLSVVIASAAVAGIRDRVVETPVAIGPPTTSTALAPASPTTTTDLVVPSTVLASTDTPPTTTVPPVTTTAASPAATTTTESPPATNTTTTTVPVTTTTVALSYETYTLIGGTVTLSFGNGEVRVVSVAPSAGFDADIEKSGPIEVEVDFESNDHKSELSAKIENGELRVETEEEPGDGDDD